MAIWAFRKIEAYIFRAGHTTNALSSASWWPTHLPIAAGMLLLCLWQCLLLIGTLAVLCAALHLQLGPHLAFWLVLIVVGCLVAINYVTLLADNQWRQLTSHIRGHSETDWMFAGLILYSCAVALCVLLGWLLPPVIDHSG
jgi:hypothetical protein